MSWPATGPVLVALTLFLLFWNRDTGLKKIPIVRFNTYWPDFLNRILFYPKAALLIYAGYEKYKESPFRILTGDGDLIVLPIKYFDELKRAPMEMISSMEAQYKNAMGDYTNILISSYLPTMTVKKRLTPALGRVVPWVVDELRQAFDQFIPECEDHWVPVKPQELFIRLVARVTSRVVAGDKLRCNEEWLNLASNYTMNVGLAVLLLRPFPRFIRSLVAPFLPPVRQMKRQLRFVKDLFRPMIEQRRVADIEHAEDPLYERPDDFLQWMMDLAEEDQDQDPEQLAHHMLLLMSLAVAHTSSMAMTHALYDLIVRPEYLPPLRDEIEKTLKGGWEKATKASFESQRRLDSFMRESQRFGPPGDLSFERITMQNLILSDGLELPKGTHICFPSGPISKDPAFISHPQTFDGFRWCHDPTDRNALPLTSSNLDLKEKERRLQVPTKATRFVDISPESMHFGAGRQACPGRFFAANTIKAIFSRIIMEYEFKFEDKRAGKRPPNLVVGEHILPDNNTPVLFRKRAIEGR